MAPPQLYAGCERCCSLLRATDCPRPERRLRPDAKHRRARGATIRSVSGRRPARTQSGRAPYASPAVDRTVCWPSGQVPSNVYGEVDLERHHLVRDDRDPDQAVHGGAAQGVSFNQLGRWSRRQQAGKACRQAQVSEPARIRGLRRSSMPRTAVLLGLNGLRVSEECGANVQALGDRGWTSHAAHRRQGQSADAATRAAPTDEWPWGHGGWTDSRLSDDSGPVCGVGLHAVGGYWRAT